MRATHTHTHSHKCSTSALAHSDLSCAQLIDAAHQSLKHTRRHTHTNNQTGSRTDAHAHVPLARSHRVHTRECNRTHLASADRTCCQMCRRCVLHHAPGATAFFFLNWTRSHCVHERTNEQTSRRANVQRSQAASASAKLPFIRLISDDRYLHFGKSDETSCCSRFLQRRATNGMPKHKTLTSVRVLNLTVPHSTDGTNKHTTHLHPKPMLSLQNLMIFVRERNTNCAREIATTRRGKPKIRLTSDCFILLSFEATNETF